MGCEPGLSVFLKIRFQKFGSCDAAGGCPLHKLQMFIGEFVHELRVHLGRRLDLWQSAQAFANKGRTRQDLPAGWAAFQVNVQFSRIDYAVFQLSMCGQ